MTSNRSPMKSSKSNTKITVGTIFFEVSRYDISAEFRSLSPKELHD